jgi:predicted transcriptional regulator
MSRSAHGPAYAFQTYRTPSGRAVAQRRRVIVALLQQTPHGLTAREIREATGFSKDLTTSALTGLFVYGVVHKQGHCYVLTAPAEACEPSAQR